MSIGIVLCAEVKTVKSYESHYDTFNLDVFPALLHPPGLRLADICLSAVVGEYLRRFAWRESCHCIILVQTKRQSFFVHLLLPTIITFINSKPKKKPLLLHYVY